MMVAASLQMILVLMTSIFALHAHGLTKNISTVATQFDVQVSTDLSTSANVFLDRFIGQESSAENLRLAEDFLSSIYGVRSAKCSYRDQGEDRELLCQLISRRNIRAINVTNLPASLLESELKRRLSIDVGQTIDVDESIHEILTVVKSRVETFLRKNGFYDAKVSVSHNAPKDAPWADINIDILGGIFARVNSVSVTGDSPISTLSIRKQFSRLCFSFNRIIEAFSIGTLKCYSRELERDAIASLQERLAKMGYVQSQIRVSHAWVSTHDKTAPENCRALDDNEPNYRCINLRVNVAKGPRFRWEVNVKDRLSISRNALQRFIASIFSVDQLSRASTSVQSDEVALDHLIIEEDLVDKVTFVAAKNVDEQELTESADAITDFLISHGYANAEVVPSLVQEDENNVVITFDVYADKPYFVDAVSVEPPQYAAFFTPEDLENLVGVRAFMENGRLAYSVIESAQEQVQTRLRARGFSEVVVHADMEAIGNGAVNVTFYVQASPREVLDEVVIINGLHDVDEEIVPALHNCDNYAPIKRHAHGVRKLCHLSSSVPHLINDDMAKLVDHYQTSGFLYAKVINETVHTKEGKKLIFTVFDSRLEGKPLEPLKRQTIDDIIITGNSNTSAAAIKRLFPKERKSTTRDPIAIKKGLASLRETGRFSRIDHKIMFGQEGSDDAYFILQVAERPSLSLDTSIAFSTDQHFSFEAELEEANLFSSMLKLNTTLAMGLFWGRQSIFSNKLVWRYVWGKPLHLTINAPIVVYEDRLHFTEPSRRLQSKLYARLDWRLTARITPYVEYWLVFTQEDKKAQAAPDFAAMVTSLDGLSTTMKLRGTIQGKLKPGITFIQLDNPFDPHSGVDINLWTELSGGPLLGDTPFVNLGAQNRFYIPLGPLTLALQASVMRAFIDPNKENFTQLRNVSVMDKLGGDHSVRGYDPDAIGITDYDGKRSQYSGYLANLANIELRFPLTSKTAIGNFSGAVFVDEGLLIPCGGLFKCSTKRSVHSLTSEKGFGLSVGGALRYSLPVGPISLDYGISPITGDHRVHILFGYSF